MDQERPRVIAITGSGSFLGSHLVGLLEDAPRVAKIISLDLKVPETAGAKTQHFDIDLTSHDVEDKMASLLREQGAETVVHLAFHHSPSHRPDDSHYLESVGTMYVLNACRRTQVRQFVLWSQTFLYGASAKNPCFLEESKPLCARTSESYFRDKMQAEKDALEFGRPGSGRVVQILRTAPIVGPNVDNFITGYLGQDTIQTVLGFDPLWQFLHESDAVAAFKRALDVDSSGIFNIAGTGVLPLSKVIRLLGRRKLPLTRPLTRLTLGALWAARRHALPPSFVDYLQYACVGDTDKSRNTLGFVPIFSSQEAVAELGAAQSLRNVQLLSETPA
jgi:UDP-glucose 4-epimerase